MRVYGLWLTALLVATTAGAEIGVWIDSPQTGESVFGPVEIAVAVESQDPVVVELFVDGKSIGILQRPPYRIQYDFGYENMGHQIRAVARSQAGESSSALVETRPVQVDERIDLNLQQLYVTVTEVGSDRRVLGLRRDDFRVQDSGARQEIVTFERGDVPLTAVLLLDCSGSMAGERLAAAVRGASLFLAGMQELDEAKLLLFSDRLLHETEFTNDAAIHRASLESVHPVGGTALNDHLFIALKKLDARQGRRVVVLFTDGSDVESVLPMRQVLKKAQISPALVYWIHLRGESEGEGAPSISSAWRNADRNREEFEMLQRAIRETGGRVRPVHSLDDLDEAFVEILAELREQYVIGYYPKGLRHDGGWRDVNVRIRRPGLAVRARGGYLDY